MKKILFNKINILLLLTGGVCLSSCLKDKRFVDFSQVGTLIELPLAASNGLGNLTPEALPILTTPQTIPVVVNVAAPTPLKTALVVTLAVDQTALTAYNHSIGADTAGGADPYTLPPNGSYTIASDKVTIPANQRTANLNISVNTSLLDPSGLYIIPITITDASGQKISNYKTILLNVQAKNQYDGVYTANGFVLRLGDNVLGGNFSGLSYPLATAGATTLSFNQTWRTGSIAGGINPCIISVNPSTNKVTVTSTVNGTLANDPNYDNRYDPSTKTFYISFAWNAPGTRAATDTLVYKGSR